MYLMLGACETYSSMLSHCDKNVMGNIIWIAPAKPKRQFDNR